MDKVDVDLQGQTNKSKDWTNRWTYEHKECAPRTDEQIEGLGGRVDGNNAGKFGKFIEDGTPCSLVEINILLSDHTVSHPRR